MKRLVVAFLILLITLCAVVYFFLLEKNIDLKEEKKVDTTPNNSTIKEKREAIKEAFGIK
ncbi:hypothetical protein CRU94_01785 [Arcobacter sp. AHV-9/2010]|uniref:hypothetical protein n=1 Tax=Arcobacter sp. AHV-9/2010 TaxID=2021861 RepID=UPI00100AF29D|nr:hypothetical protein [Arcobacter sp. CECT 9299]RXJ96867.1 hypothetical protein CRU94_01785 [Arcobacter sp. CECT 9299]